MSSAVIFLAIIAISSIDMISPPSTASTAAPRICRVSTSTTALMKPRGSAISKARATQLMGILATRMVRPCARASCFSATIVRKSECNQPF